MRLPNIAGTLSDATKLKWSDLDQTLTELLFQNIITDDFANLDDWTEVDSGTNVNLSDGIVTMNGNGSYATNGIFYTAGVPRAEGYFEIKAKCLAVSISAWLIAIINTVSTLPAGIRPAGTVGMSGSASNASPSQGVYVLGVSPVVNDIYYTIRLYPLKVSNGGVDWKGFKCTIEGGIYITETTLAISESTVAELPETLYFTLSRRANSIANLTSIKEFRWYSGYDTGGEYSEYVHDAGVGKIFNNFDPSALAMPGSVPSTNLKFSYSFDTGTPSFSGWLTLAELNSEGKQTADRRYIRIRVQSNSDGSTQAYGAKPVSDTAIDGIGDFPASSNVYLSDTVQGITGTYDKIYTATEEAARNIDPTEALVFLDTTYKIHNVEKTGSLSVGAPGVPDNLVATALDSENIKLTWTPIANTESIYVEHSTDNVTFTIIDTLTDDTFAAEYTHTGLTAESIHYYKIKVENDIGQSEYSEIVSSTTSATVTAPTTINPIMDFYQITSSDSGDVTETLRHENIFGELQMAEVKVGDDRISFEIIQLYIFFPEKYLDNIEKNMKVVSGDGTEFKIITIEDFEEHQEIKLKKIKD